MRRYLKQNIRVIGLVLGLTILISVAYHVVEGKIEEKHQKELNSQTWGSKNYGVKVEPLTFSE
ncbi:hypothetical protein [Aliivibrio fischeri]|uniref:Uncharacterized protein n=1 Tax=Aliivibrio fischeri TaxID=668 RepID=A0A844P864_ALIFS|nr:hypothetical protein [Aliivibrio fischeri]MUK51564.1 hypothetical protein [Aliivibrio fischeri]